MTPKATLIELLGRVGAEPGATVLINDAELRQWPTAAVVALKSQGLIVRARPASSAICPGCERECVMPVYTPPTTTGLPASFIVCDKRSDINRVLVPTEQLTQWQCSAETVCAFVANRLGLRRSDRRSASAGRWEIGIALGNKRHQRLCLQADGRLALVAGNQAIPLAELISYHEGVYSLDDVLIRQLVDSATTSDKRYTPSNARREAHKLNTQARYGSWQKAHREWKRKHPGMTDVWYSQQIAKMDIAQGRDAETIRKHLKK